MQEMSYPISFNLKIPWLSKLFYYLFILCLLLFLVSGFYMLPATTAPDEMKTVYFLLTTSEWEKLLLGVGVIGAPVFFILYKFLRIKRQGLLRLLSDRIEFDDHKTITSYTVSDITEVSFNDAAGIDGFPKGKLTIDFIDQKKTLTRVTLLDYSQCEEVMTTLLNYPHIRFNKTDFSYNPELLDD